MNIVCCEDVLVMLGRHAVAALKPVVDLSNMLVAR
jgi:hypothetical protein